MKWSSFPHMWPALEHLEIQKCFGLSINNVSSWSEPQFISKLKTVVLPDDFARLGTLPNSSIRIGFSSSNHQDCYFLKEESEDSNSDENDYDYDDGADYYDDGRSCREMLKEMCGSDVSLDSDYGGYF